MIHISQMNPLIFFVKSADNGRRSGYGGTKITFLEFTNLAEMKFVKDKF